MIPQARRYVLLPLLLGVTLLSIVIVPVAAGGGSGEEREITRLRLATTTSTENSGLLEELLPAFEEENDVTVDVVAVGTGQALELGRNGDMDVVMTHAPELEREFVEQGYGVERVKFMHNDFVLLGPSADPAGVGGVADVAEAFRRIAEREWVFISRGDNSGTHAKERAVWEEAGVSPEGSWYREAGQGMGAVITMANNEEAYTLADRGTFLAYRGEIELEVKLDGDPLIAFLVSDAGQRIIDAYRVEGEQRATGLSGGERQRLAVARAVALEPERRYCSARTTTPPPTVFLARAALSTSAQNRFRGRVTEVRPFEDEQGSCLHPVGLDCGFPLQARVTAEALGEPGIRPGADLVAGFKASAVRLY
ncbi:MAG: substrate-binding domain-containing protein [Spirochaetaceae bacterium]